MNAPDAPEAPSSPPPFLHVPTLLELSEPMPRVNWFWYGAGVFSLLVGASSLASAQSAQVRAAVQLLSLLLLFALMGIMAMATMFTVRQHRAQQQSVEAIEELIQLRRWDQAGMALQLFLSQPARSPRMRAQALVYLTSLLSRHHRFEDALALQNYLLENDLVDDSTGFALRLGRAMAMLHQDHLVDANAAISDLRRRAGSQRSGGLALVEIYRDIKTGHPAEAIELFAENISVMQQQLGHRVADAHALVARAYDLLGRDAQARAAYERATLLSPASELHRRYPEAARLAEKYAPAAAPRELT